MATPDKILELAADITKAAVSASPHFGITNDAYQEAVVDILGKVTKKLNELAKSD